MQTYQKTHPNPKADKQISEAGMQTWQACKQITKHQKQIQKQTIWLVSSGPQTQVYRFNSNNLMQN